jgi:type IV pilus assembly protein PilP
MPRAAAIAAVLVLAACPALRAAAQAPAPAPAPVPAAGQPPVPEPPPPSPADGYSYDPAGRRDPFLNLLGAGTSPRTGAPGEGPAGMLVAEISVRGVMQTRGELVAAIQGPDNRTYLVRAGDQLADGVIKALTPEGLIIIQDVNDPLSVVKQREVQKRLPSLDETKE